MAYELANVLRTLALLEKALNRLGRLNYLERKQYPPIFLAVEDTLNQTRLWIRENSHLSSLKVLYESPSDFLDILACWWVIYGIASNPNRAREHPRGLLGPWSSGRFSSRSTTCWQT